MHLILLRLLKRSSLTSSGLEATGSRLFMMATSELLFWRPPAASRSRSTREVI